MGLAVLGFSLALPAWASHIPAIYTVAGGGAGADGSSATDAKLLASIGVAFDPSGNLYIAEYSGHRVRKVDVRTKVITTVAGTGVSGYSGDGEAAAEAQLKGPAFVAFVGADLYITDYDDHRVRKVDGATGKIETVAGIGGAGNSGDGRAATLAQLRNPAGLTYEAASGLLYIADAGNHRIRAIDLTNGMINAVAGTGQPGSTDGNVQSASFNLPLDVKLGDDGSLYVADYAGNKVRKIRQGFVTTVAGNSADLALSSPYGLAVGGEDVYIAEYGSHRVRRLRDGILTTVAGAGVAGYGGDGNLASAARLKNPNGLVLSADGSLFVGDSGNLRVRRVTLEASPSEVLLESDDKNAPWDLTATVVGMDRWLALTPTGSVTFADLGDGDTVRDVYCDADLLALREGEAQAQCSVEDMPAGSHRLVANYDGDAVYAGRLSNELAVRLQKQVAQASQINSKDPSSSSEVIRTVEVNAGEDGDRQSLAAQGRHPSGVALNEFGYPNIGSALNHRIRKVTPQGAVGTVTSIDSYQDSQAGAKRKHYPMGLALDREGNLYAADFDGHRIVKMAPDGSFVTVAGTGERGYSGDGGMAVVAQLNYPADLELDDLGNLYVADAGNHCIRKITPQGAIVTVAGMGAPGDSGDGRLAIAARLNYPVGVTLDKVGNLYIADFNNHRIRKVTPQGTITTVAGTGAPGDSGDGRLAVDAQLNYPTDAVLDESEDLYVVDFSNHRIRKVDTDTGIIATMAGTTAHNREGDGPQATAAELYYPLRAAFDEVGNLYIADSGNDSFDASKPQP